MELHRLYIQGNTSTDTKGPYLLAARVRSGLCIQRPKMYEKVSAIIL
jgi:hypothetical protein